MSRSFLSFLPSLRAAWQWWTGELWETVPQRWRQRLAGHRRALVVLLTRNHRAALLQRGAAREEKLAELDLSMARIAEARVTLAAVRQRSVATTLRLPADAGLSVTMTLPAATEVNLDQVVSFELDRRTPFKREEVYHHQRVAERLDGGKNISVELTVVRRPEVDGAVALAKVLGLTLDRIEVAGRTGSNFLPRHARLLGTRPSPFLLGGLAAAAALLVLGAMFIPILQAHHNLATLQQMLAVVKQRADDSLRLQKEIDAEIQESDFLAARRRQLPLASEVLYDLTHLLPDDTWISEVEIIGGEVHISGYADSASMTLGLIDQSHRFVSAAFRSPVVQNQQANREQFNITARIVRP